MDQNVEPLTPSRLGLARKFQLGGAFLGGLENSNEFLEGITVLRGSKGFIHRFFSFGDRVPLRENTTIFFKTFP